MTDSPKDIDNPDTPNADEAKTRAEDTANQVVSELKKAFSTGREDAKRVASDAADRVKEAAGKGGYGAGYGAGFAATFVSTLLEDVLNENIRNAVEKGSEAGEKAAREFRTKVADTVSPKEKTSGEETDPFPA